MFYTKTRHNQTSLGLNQDFGIGFAPEEINTEIHLMKIIIITTATTTTTIQRHYKSVTIIVLKVVEGGE